jgi:hypothetical protein
VVANPRVYTLRVTLHRWSPTVQGSTLSGCQSSCLHITSDLAALVAHSTRQHIKWLPILMSTHYEWLWKWPCIVGRSDAMMYIASFAETNSGIKKLPGRIHRQHANRISLFVICIVMLREIICCWNEADVWGESFWTAPELTATPGVIGSTTYTSRNKHGL